MNMTSSTLLIMAAGGGERYGGLKQVEPLGPCGATFTDYSVFDALQAGFNKVVFVIRRDIEKTFRTSVGMRIENQVDVRYIFQGEAVPAPPVNILDRKKPWGTAHAVLSAANVIDEPFVVINADDFYGQESFAIVNKYLQLPNSDAVLVGFSLRNALSAFGPVKRGLCDLSGEMLLRVTEVDIVAEGSSIHSVDIAGTKRQLTGDEVVSMNMWGFKPPIFEAFHRSWIRFARASGQSATAEFYIPIVMSEFIANDNGQCRVLETPSRWFGVTYSADRPVVVKRIQDLIKDGVYPERLWPDSH